MSEQKTVKKKAAIKKAPVKKAATTKKAGAKPPISKGEADFSTGIQAMVAEISRDRETRDKQISSLIHEVRDGFTTLSKNTSKQSIEHEKEMTGLYRSLQDAFGMIKEGTAITDKHNLNIFKSLSDSIMKDHEQSLKEVHEQEKLQDKKFKYMAKLQEQRTGRNRLIAIPGVIIAITGIVYMFYVVSVMESAMTSMSLDMHQIQQSVGTMSENVGHMSTQINTISQNTGSMNDNLQQLNTSTDMMSKDLNVMTHNVAPAMKGLRNVMPWSP